MVVIGVVLVVIGVALLIAEAHVPAGFLGAAGGISVAVGAAVAISAAGAGLVLAIPVALGAAAAAGLWLAVATRKAIAAQLPRARSGREALSGRLGTVRSWAGNGGQVLVDGALWRARPSWPDGGASIHTGDQIVVERVSGLTLGVRKAEEWESPWS
jgi:membrane-bound ClpP family serine protease